MKFCYLDESGIGDEPFAVMVGVVADGSRMHLTKSEWRGLLSTLSKITRSEVKEFHARHFYPGNSHYRGVSGEVRSRVISAVLDWLKARKHQVTFVGLDKEKFFAELKSDERVKKIGSLWCLMALHQVLVIQKAHQVQKNNKGNTVFVFDREVSEEARFCDTIYNPPTWTDSYYGFKKGERLSQIVDVPYFADSVHAHLVQVADLIAYLLRRYVEIEEGTTPPKFSDEKEKLTKWINQVAGLSMPRSTRYPKTQRDPASDLFFNLAPPSLRELGK